MLHLLQLQTGMSADGPPGPGHLPQRVHHADTSCSQAQERYPDILPRAHVQSVLLQPPRPLAALRHIR